MCTVIVDVGVDHSVRMLAVRDEDPRRAWDPLGLWWPDTYPGVVGVHDRRAGGAWMAINAAQGRVAVLLNRADTLDLAEAALQSRGSLALESVMGRSPSGALPMHGFNLLEFDRSRARVLSWNGVELTETPVTAGTHMIAHNDLDDPSTPRIARWLPSFRSRMLSSGDSWREAWVSTLAETTQAGPFDDEAIIRDNTPHGYPTQSLLYALVEQTTSGVQASDHTLTRPGYWNDVRAEHPEPATDTVTTEN